MPAQTPYSVRQVDSHCGSSETVAERTPMAVAPIAGILLLLAVALLPPVRAAPVCDPSCHSNITIDAVPDPAYTGWCCPWQSEPHSTLG